MTLRVGMLLLLFAWCQSAPAQPDTPAKPFVPEPILSGGVVRKEAAATVDGGELSLRSPRAR